MIQPTQLPTVRKSLMATTTQSSPWLTGIIAGLSLTAAHGADWNGSSSTDWNTAANWTPGGDPNGAHAIVNTNSPNRAIINANMSGTPIDINVGSVSGSNTRLDHLTGNGQTGVGNWMFVGRGGGTGVYNLANTAGTGGPLTGFSAGTGSMNVRGRLIIGGENSAGSIGTVNVHTSGTLTVRDNLLIGTGNATSSDTGTLNIDSGLMTTGNWTEIGRGGANCKGYINISGGRASASSPAAASSPPSLAPTDSSVSATTMAPRVSWKSPAPTRSSTATSLSVPAAMAR
jgi:fibronectin-binding autotransporter adhesin